MFFNRAEFYFFFVNFGLLKLDEPFRNQEIYIISIVLNSVDLSFKIIFVCCSFWLIFCPFDPDQWICVFLRIQIRIQEAKILDPDPKHWINLMFLIMNPLKFSSSMIAWKINSKLKQMSYEVTKSNHWCCSVH